MLIAHGASADREFHYSSDVREETFADFQKASIVDAVKELREAGRPRAQGIRGGYSANPDMPEYDDVGKAESIRAMLEEALKAQENNPRFIRRARETVVTPG